MNEVTLMSTHVDNVTNNSTDILFNAILCRGIATVGLNRVNRVIIISSKLSVFTLKSFNSDWQTLHYFGENSLPYICWLKRFNNLNDTSIWGPQLVFLLNFFFFIIHETSLVHPEYQSKFMIFSPIKYFNINNFLDLQLDLHTHSISWWSSIPQNPIICMKN